MKHKPFKILIIDDDYGCRMAAARFFSSVSRHSIEVAENGSEGLKKAGEMKPDIIFLDMCMPGMDGLEVMDALYADTVTREIPVAVITGSSLSDSEQDSLSARPNFSLLREKPVIFKDLLETIETRLSLQQCNGNNRQQP
jgi:CheY-like chemotaxis protein